VSPHGRAKHDNSRAAEAKNGLFLAAMKRNVERVNLNDPFDRQGSDFHEPEPPEVCEAFNEKVVFSLQAARNPGRSSA
jgi:hypothetical protein